jgi:hypothetical protein
MLSIFIEADAAGIGISAYSISVWYRRFLVQDWVPLFRYQTRFNIGILAPY